MPGEQRGAERPTGVAGRRLDPDVVVRAFPQQPAVGDAVQRHAAGQHQMLHPGLLVHVAAHAEHDLFGDRLDAGRQIHVSLLDVRLGIPRRAAEQPVEAMVRHGQALAVVEIVHVQPEAAVGLQIDQMLADRLGVDGRAVGGQAHELVLAAVDLEPAVVGEGRVEEPQRVRELQVLPQVERVAPPDAPGRRRPLTDAVQGEHGRFVEGAREEGAGRVALVVIHEQERRARLLRQTAPDHAAHHQLFAEPDGHRHDEAADAARRERQLGLEQALEFQHRLVVEGDEVELLGAEPRLVQTVRDGVARKPRVVFFPREPLFLRGRDDIAIDDDRGGAVVIKGGNSQNIHGRHLIGEPHSRVVSRRSSRGVASPDPPLPGPSPVRSNVRLRVPLDSPPRSPE